MVGMSEVSARNSIANALELRLPYSHFFFEVEIKRPHGFI